MQFRAKAAGKDETPSAPAASASPMQEKPQIAISSKKETDCDSECLTNCSDKPFFESQYEPLEYEKDAKPTCFISHLGFEQKQSETNRLILSVRYHQNHGRSKTATVYLHQPITIATKPKYSFDKIKSIINQVKADEELRNGRMTIYVSKKDWHELPTMKKEHPDILFLPHESKESVVHLAIPCEHRLFEKLPKAFLVGSHDKQIRRQLEWMYRETILHPKLVEASEVVDEVNDIGEKIGEIVSLIFPFDPSNPSANAKRSRLLNEIHSFYTSFGRVCTLQNKDVRKKYPSLSKLQREHPEEFKRVMNLQREMGALLSRASADLTHLDDRNELHYNRETRTYEIVLYSVWGNKPPQGINITDQRISYGVWYGQSTCILDIEKAMWKSDRERELIALLGTLEEMKSKPDCPYELARINDVIKKVQKHLVMHTHHSGDVDITEDRYKEQISSVQLHFLREDGSETKFCFNLVPHSLMAAARSLKDDSGFIDLLFEDERDLISSVLSVLRTEKPYRLAGHFSPYDLINIREGAREANAGSMDLIVNDKEPRLWRRGFYQKVSMPAEEHFDTNRVISVVAPYMKTAEIGMNHKLADSSNFVWRLKRSMGISTVMKNEFRKIQTHDQLKELAVRIINGDFEAYKIMNQYSKSDLAPVQEILTFEPWMKSIYEAGLIVPHAPITDVAFSPTAINEAFIKTGWDNRHTQIHFGYEEKMRKDEQEIFKKRLSEYMRRQLADEGIMHLSRMSGTYRNVYMTYIPIEYWMRTMFFPNKPNWGNFFINLSDNPLVMIGQLSFPKSFMRKNEHVDYYLYRREKDIERQCRTRSGLNREELKVIFERYEELVSSQRPKLLREYYGKFNSLKETFRNFYISLDSAPEKQGRGTRKYISIPSGRRESTQMILGFLEFTDVIVDPDEGEQNGRNGHNGKNGKPNNRRLERIGAVSYFEADNADLAALRKLPREFERALREDSIEHLKKFRSLFDAFEKAKSEIVSILSASGSQLLTDRMAPEDIAYSFMQKTRAKNAWGYFKAVYHVNPEGEGSFREMLDASYKSLGAWVESKGLHVLGYKDDYLYVRRYDEGEIDFKNAPVIPIWQFPSLEFTKQKSKKKEEKTTAESQQPDLFSE